MENNKAKQLYQSLVEYEIEKINIAESIKSIKESLKEAGFEKEDIATLAQAAAAKAKGEDDKLANKAASINKILEIIE
jgi:phosphoenolpyruvate carboxylase